ncbi:MAG: hypothetical protein ACI9VN_002473 [Patescibacteria group bacterium]|jgi:hypothetical protein
MLQTRYFWLLFTLVFTLSCQTEPKKEEPVKKEMTTAEKRDEASKDWRAFWPIFQKAVKEGDVETLVSHIEFPLKGSEVFNDGKQISKASFSKHFSKIFDATARATFAETDNMSDFATKNQQVADQLNVPANKKIKTMMVLYITDEGKENQTESSVTFQFVEVSPMRFKLYSLVTAG